ncbi:MAG TPA: HEAT repeat domain-containing protein, partial [bacterium]|nr:HEAT repeat domain-containing protein [bacterium]
MLYNPIPAERRGGMRGFVEGYIKPVAMCIAGIVLVFVAPFLSFSQISALALVLSLSWVFFSFCIKKGYVDALVKNLTAKGAALEEYSVRELSRLSGADNVAVIRKVLCGENDDSIALALETVENLRLAGLKDDIVRLLDRPLSAAAACAAIRTLDSFRLKDLKEVFARFIDNPDPQIQAYALGALAHVSDADDAQIFNRYADSAHTAVKTEAMIALISLGGFDGILAVAERLKAMSQSDRAQDKRAVCAVIGDIRIKHFIPVLAKMIGDRDAEVRQCAVRALSNIRDDKAYALLIGCLADRRLRAAALKGLISFGPEIAGVCIGAIRTGGSPAVRRGLAKVIGRIKEADPEEALAPLLKDPDPVVRGEALKACERRFKKEPAPRPFCDRLDEYIRFEIREIYRNLYGTFLIQERYRSGGARMLSDALQEENDFALRRIFKALGVLIDQTTVYKIYRNLTDPDPKVQALAYEALENIGIREITTLLAPVFDEKPLKDKALYFKSSMAADEFMRGLLGGPHAWMCAVAIYTLGLNRDKEFAGGLADHARSDDPLVAETAGWALRQMA